MPATTKIADVGIPVELDAMERELKKLWDESGGTLTRASLVNFAIYSEEANSVARNTELISQITEHLACRAMVINVNRAAKIDRVRAWINAHCHARTDKTRQVCSEQLSFAVEGPCVNLLDSIVFSHLDSDLPFYLWWQGEFHDPMDSQLWAWVDRLIYDSQTWRDFRAQLRLLADARSDAKNRVVLCDLNWTRLVPMRMAVAQFFDHPASRHHLAKFDHCEIDFAPGYRSTALLLAGWLAAQLDWKLEKENRSFALNFRDKTGRPVKIVLNQNGVEPINRCFLRNNLKEFRVTRAAGADMFEVSCTRPAEESTRQLMPAGENDPVALINLELTRGGPRRVYLRALQQVRDLI
jgi:glucose-6-phosphate dehydrogenase assembly protein OpcA